MSLRIVVALALLSSLATLGGLQLRADEPAAPSSPKDAVEPGSKAGESQGRMRPGPFQLPDEKNDQCLAVIARFHEEPKKEDFDELETHAAFLRAAPGPMPAGGQWIAWFYGQLQAPEKRDAESWKKHFENLDRWIAAKPESATPLVVAARARLARGWEERGSGAASTVSEARWIIFHDQLERASDLLERARAAKDHDADVYLQLILVGKATGADREDIDEFVAAARKLNPEYYAVWPEAAVYLLPRWSGDPGDIAEFTDEMLAEIPGEEGLEIYARIACVLNFYDRQYLLGKELDVQKVRAGARVLQRRFPNSTYYQNFAGLVGWRTQDLELARGAKKIVEGEIDNNFWGHPLYVREFQRFCDLSIAPPTKQRILWSTTGSPIVTAISPSGNSLIVGEQSGTGAGPISIRSLKDLSVIEELAGVGTLTDSLAIDSAGTKLAVTFQAYPPGRVPSRLVLYNVGDWENPQFLTDSRAATFGAACFSPDGKYLAVAHTGAGIGIWNVASQKLERIIESVANVRRIFFSPDGKLVVGQHESQAQISDFATGEALHRLPLAPAPDGAQINTVLGYLEDGRLLAAGRHKDHPGTSLYSWDPVSKKRRDLILGAPGTIRAVSPKLSYMVLQNSTNDRQTRTRSTSLSIWSIPEKRRLAEYGVVAPPTGYSFSQDEKILAFASQDRSVRVWNLPELLSTEK